MNDQTTGNRRIVEDFADLLYLRLDVRTAFEKHVSADDYIQHNPGLPDGREAAIHMLESKFQAPGFSAAVQRIIVDGNLALVHLHARPAPDHRGAAVADIFRLENGKIVEHWDVLQSVPDDPVSTHPMF
jgi:predicted SnoaL-like aldol condensation-catalyzing enzyme